MPIFLDQGEKMAAIAQEPYKFAFDHNNETHRIYCQIETPRLTLESFDKNKHGDAYQRIFSNQANFVNHRSCVDFNNDKIAERTNIWHKRWLEGNPFSALAIIKKEGHEVIGHIVLDRGRAPGISKAACIIDAPFQEKGYGTEAAKAIKQKFVPRLISGKYKVGGARFKGVEATVNPINRLSLKILRKIDFRQTDTDIRYKGQRMLFHYDVGSKRFLNNPLAMVVGSFLVVAAFRFRIISQ